VTKPHESAPRALQEENLKSEGGDDLSLADVEVLARADVSLDDTVRISAQLPVHSSGPLLSHFECESFRKGIFKQGKEEDEMEQNKAPSEYEVKRPAAGSTPAAATAATKAATGATATPAAAANGFSLEGSSQGSSLAGASAGPSSSVFSAPAARRHLT